MPDTKNPTPKKPATSKETKEERASRLLHKAQGLKKAALRTKINKTMQLRPECMPEIASHLVELGFMDADRNTIQLPSKVRKLDKQPVPAAARDLNNNFTKVCTMPCNRLQAWLAAMEPVTFSANNCKSVVIRGKIQESRERLAQCFEFVTGVDPEEPLFEGGRDHTYLEAFVAELVELNRSRGRLAHELVLLADWQKVGFYIVEQRGKQFNLVAPHHGLVSIALPAKIAKGATDTSHFQVHMNYSERRAVIRGPLCTVGTVCRDLLVKAMSADDFAMPQFAPPATLKTQLANKAEVSGSDCESARSPSPRPAKRAKHLALTDGPAARRVCGRRSSPSTEAAATAAAAQPARRQSASGRWRHDDEPRHCRPGGGGQRR